MMQLLFLLQPRVDDSLCQALNYVVFKHYLLALLQTSVL